MRLPGQGRPRLETLRLKRDLDGLRRAATYTDTIVARNGQILDRGVPVRVEALEALSSTMSESEDEAVRPTLVAGLRDGAPEVRRTAVKALGRDSAAEANAELVDFLATDLARGDAGARDLALEQVCESGWPGCSERWARKVVEGRAGPLDDADREVFELLLAADSSATPEQRVFDALAPALGSRSSTDELCVTVLGWCVPTHFDGLAGRLAAERVPEALIRLAGLTGDQELVEPLTKLLDRSDRDLRREAARALGALCDTRAAVPLLRATRDADLAVRQSAVAAFDSLGGAGVTAAMSLLIQERNGDLSGVDAPPPALPSVRARGGAGGAGSIETGGGGSGSSPPADFGALVGAAVGAALTGTSAAVRAKLRRS